MHVNTIGTHTDSLLLKGPVVGEQLGENTVKLNKLAAYTC